MQRACLTELQSLARRRAEGARAAVDRDGREVLINVCREGDIQLSGETCAISSDSPRFPLPDGGRGRTGGPGLRGSSTDYADGTVYSKALGCASTIKYPLAARRKIPISSDGSQSVSDNKKVLGGIWHVHASV
jgi:hypothetical protein